MGLIFLAIFFALSTTNFGVPGFLSNNQNPPLQASAQKDCSYNVQSQSWVETGSVRDASLYGSFFLGKKWVLIKSDVNVPTYKVIGGFPENIYKREMDKVGLITNTSPATTDEKDKPFFINIGHCNPSDLFDGDYDAGECIQYDSSGNQVANAKSEDPLSTAAIFVPTKQGRTTPYNSNVTPLPQIPGEKTITVSDPNGELWSFNIYLREDLLIANAGGNSYDNDDVPCWLSQCRGGDLRIGGNQGSIIPEDWNKSCGILSQSGTPVPTPPAQTGSYGLEESLGQNDPYPPSFIKKDWINVTSTDTQVLADWGQVRDTSWFAGKVKKSDFDSRIPKPKQLGTFRNKLGVKDETYTVHVDRISGGAFSNGRLYLEPTIQQTGYLYSYIPTSYRSPLPTETKGETLKLGTFTAETGFVYEWWYPSCKPVVYLYPEKETSFNVKLKPFGILTDSIPQYPWFTGWKNVLAKPDGKLTYQGQNYDYLYYEGRSFFVKVPKEGFVARGSELSGVFDAILPQLGLNDKEITDFKEYWLSRLNEPETFYSISILPREEIDRVEPMEVTPTPDTLIRVRLFFKKLDRPELLPLPVLPATVARYGTTIVDWGGFFK